MEIVTVVVFTVAYVRVVSMVGTILAVYTRIIISLVKKVIKLLRIEELTNVN